MRELLKTYLNHPTLKNAKKLCAYAHKHPFSLCLMTQFDTSLLEDAVHQIKMSET